MAAAARRQDVPENRDVLRLHEEQRNRMGLFSSPATRSRLGRCAGLAMLGAGLVLLAAVSTTRADPAGETALREKSAALRHGAHRRCDTSVMLGGDTILTLPWSHVTEPAFLHLIAEIRAADAAIVNLETMIHTFKGYAQRDSGGSHVSSPPEVADDLAWAGVDMVAHANNHAFDFGSIAILENLEFVTAAGIVLAGSGPDLQRARAPAYFVTAPRDGGKGAKIGLVSMASTFAAYGQASNSNARLAGRPGINPLTLIKKPEYVIPRGLVSFMQRTERFLGYTDDRFDDATFRVGGFNFRVGERFGRLPAPRAEPRDLNANLAAIRTAARQADIVVVSLHYHGTSADALAWLQRFARRAIAAGADVVHYHGPHFVRGVEIYHGKPILYGMGDFVFQIEQIDRLPAEVYEEYGLSDDLSAQQAITAVWGKRKGSLLQRPRSYEGYGATLCFAGGRVVDMRLLPVDLHFGAGLDVRGRPGYAGHAIGARIIAKVAAASRRYGTKVTYDPAANLGRITLTGPSLKRQ